MAYLPKKLVFLGSDPATVAILREIVAGSRAAEMAQGINVPAESAALDGAPAEPATLEIVTSQKAALRYLIEHPTATVVVEAGLRPGSRVRFCQTLRSRIPTAPIVTIVGATGTTMGGGMGAALRPNLFSFDAALTVPLNAQEVRRTLSAVGNPTGPLRTIGPIQLDIVSRRVSSARGQFNTTPKQCGLLRLLMENAGQVVRRADIMRKVWDTAYVADTRTLDVHIRWLRKIIEPDPAVPIYLITVRGEGYMFVAPEDGER